MAKVSVYSKTTQKSSSAGYVDQQGKSFMVTRAIIADGGFAVTAWDDRPDEGTTKLLEGVYVGATGETIRCYRNKGGTGTTINTGIGGVLMPGRYRWKSEHKPRGEWSEHKEKAVESHVERDPAASEFSDSGDDIPFG